MLFQFPSNGKVYTKGYLVWLQTQVVRFNSLQTGRCIQSKSTYQCKWGGEREFQFPSNGKVYTKRSWKRSVVALKSFNSLQTGRCIQRQPVPRRDDNSWLFQFPSNGKVYTKKDSQVSPETLERIRGFNSLQTGRCIQSIQVSRNDLPLLFCFNSLQTGRCIQSLSTRENMGSVIRRFNSLQTGRCIQSDIVSALESGDIRFQFPSNGKVYTKVGYTNIT